MKMSSTISLLLSTLKRDWKTMYISNFFAIITKEVKRLGKIMKMQKTYGL